MAALTRARASGEELWLDPNVPLMEAGKGFGTITKQSPNFGKHKTCDHVNGRSKATRSKRATLIHTAAGTDLGTRSILCVVPEYHLKKTAARSGSVCSILLSMARREIF